MSTKLDQFFNDKTQDAFLYLAQKKLPERDPHLKQEWVDEMTGLLALIPGEIARDEYMAQLAKLSKIPKAIFKKHLQEQIEKRIQKATKSNEDTRSLQFLPKGVDPDQYLQDGFYGIVNGEKTGYYFRDTVGGEAKRVSNFVMTPLFHKYDYDDDTRIAMVENGTGPTEVVEMPSEAFISIDQFRKFMISKGVYYFDGTKAHLDKLVRKILPDFPKAYELKTLGWQREGFFAFYNSIHHQGQHYSYNDAGVVQIGECHFFSPASSKIYEDYRKEDDQFENDRYLEFLPSPIKFEEWADMFKRVYEDHAYAGIPFVFLTLFRDVVFKVDNNCPFLYAYGQSKSGKSKFAESISNLFFREMPAFNLNSGTDFAFAQRLARFRNCPVFFNEFDDNVVKDEWFQALKGAYDGEGRERGKGGSKRKTEIQRINSTLILAGQYLSTKDDNSVLSRSILRHFKIKRNRSEEQTRTYNELKKLEKEGLGGILTEILAHREVVEKPYYQEFNEIFKELGKIIRTQDEYYDERVLRNYSALTTMVKIFGSIFSLPFSLAEYKEWVIQEIMTLSNMINDNDVLSGFWNIVETLLDKGEITEGLYFKIDNRASVKVLKESQTEVVHFNKPKALLFLRLKNVHPIYASFKRRAGSHPIDLTSLTAYLKDRSSFIGVVNSERFKDRTTGKSFPTSAFVFDYRALGVALDRESTFPISTVANNRTDPETELDNKDIDLPF